MEEVNFRCPVCGRPLVKIEKAYRCENLHSFDIASQGYVNLLLSSDMHSKHPGDSKEMAGARTAFLNGGYYAPLAEKIAKLCGELSSHGVILDAGCGDGYYVSAISRNCPGARLIGIDLSKDAVRAAAKRVKTAAFAVANCFSLPLPDACADIVLQIFAPTSDAEFSRVLKQDGRLITVIPGERHLYGLKEKLYATPYLNDEEGYALPSFEEIRKERVAYDITVNTNEQIQNLFRMTPYFWRTEGKGGALQTLTSLETPAEFVVSVYEKHTASLEHT